MKDLKTFIIEAKLDPNAEDNKVIDYVISSFNEHFDKFIKGVKKIQDDWDCDINDIVRVNAMPYEKVKIESIKTLYDNLSKHNIKLPKAKVNDLSFGITVKYYADNDSIVEKSSSYASKNKDIDKLRDEFMWEGFEFNLNAKPNKVGMFIVGHSTSLRDRKWLNIGAGYNKLSEVKDVIDDYCYKCPLFENPSKIVSAKDIKSKIDKIKEMMANTKDDSKSSASETPITKLINKQSDVVKYIFNNVLNVSAMDVYWDKETTEFGKEFVELVSKWAKDVKSKDNLTVLSSKPSYWKDLTEVEIAKTTRKKVNDLMTDDSISADEWIEVSVNGDYLVIVSDMYDAGSDYFDIVIKK